MFLPFCNTLGSFSKTAAEELGEFTEENSNLPAKYFQQLSGTSHSLSCESANWNFPVWSVNHSSSLPLSTSHLLFTLIEKKHINNTNVLFKLGSHLWYGTKWLSLLMCQKKHESLVSVTKSTSPERGSINNLLLNWQYYHCLLFLKPTIFS